MKYSTAPDSVEGVAALAHEKETHAQQQHGRQTIAHKKYHAVTWINRLRACRDTNNVAAHRGKGGIPQAMTRM